MILNFIRQELFDAWRQGNLDMQMLVVMSLRVRARFCLCVCVCVCVCVRAFTCLRSSVYLCL
jgi:hypothetical protein